MFLLFFTVKNFIFRHLKLKGNVETRARKLREERKGRLICVDTIDRRTRRLVSPRPFGQL